VYEMVGPGSLERWLKWKYVSNEQRVKSAVKTEVENLLTNIDVSKINFYFNKDISR